MIKVWWKSFISNDCVTRIFDFNNWLKMNISSVWTQYIFWIQLQIKFEWEKLKKKLFVGVCLLFFFQDKEKWQMSNESMLKDMNLTTADKLFCQFMCNSFFFDFILISSCYFEKNLLWMCVNNRRHSKFESRSPINIKYYSYVIYRCEPIG